MIPNVLAEHYASAAIKDIWSGDRGGRFVRVQFLIWGESGPVIDEQLDELFLRSTLVGQLRPRSAVYFLDVRQRSGDALALPI
jgi:hypothetical protein